MLVATICRKSGIAPFVIAGRYRAIVMCTGAEVPFAPRLSEATAVRVCDPTSRRTLTLKGLVGSLPNDRVPSKNSTLVTLPPGSDAEARIVSAAELLKTAPSTGLVMVTLGGVFSELTVT